MKFYRAIFFQLSCLIREAYRSRVRCDGVKLNFNLIYRQFIKLVRVANNSKRRSQLARGLEDEFVVKLSNSGMAGLLSRWYSPVVCAMYRWKQRSSFLGAHVAGRARFIAENDLGRVPALPIRV